MNETGNPHECYVNIYPNPSPGHCLVEFDANSGTNLHLGLYDMSGKVVLQRKEFAPEGNYVFQLSGIQAGVYIMKVESDHTLYTANLISTGAGTDCPVTKNNEPTYGIGKRPYLSRTKEMKDAVSTWIRHTG